MNPVSVIVAKVVTLNPKYQYDIPDLKIDVLYTYHQTCRKDGVQYIYIDQTRRWYLKDYFKAHDIPLN